MGCANLRSTTKQIIKANPIIIHTSPNKDDQSDPAKNTLHNKYDQHEPLKHQKETDTIKNVSGNNTNLQQDPTVASKNKNLLPIPELQNKIISYHQIPEPTESMKLIFKSSLTNLLINTNHQSDTKDNISCVRKINNFVLTDTDKILIKTALSNHFLFKDKAIQIINILIDNLTLLKLTPGTTLFKRGDKGKKFYIIKSGLMELITEYGTKILSAKDTFGELALIESKKRTATVKSVDECYLYSLNGKLFREIVTKMNESELKARLTFIKIVPIFSKTISI
jgi:hypothetical protein